MTPRDTLSIAEIPYDSGELRFRYSRYLSEDGTRWIRAGLFQSFHRNGQLASEGEYQDGLETGAWRDYHENGQLAAEGEYREGKKCGRWKFFDGTGKAEEDVVYFGNE